MNIRDIAIMLVVVSIFLTGFTTFYTTSFDAYDTTMAESDINSTSSQVIEEMRNFSQEISNTIQTNSSYNQEAQTAFAVFGNSFSVMIRTIQNIPNTFQLIINVLVSSLPPEIGNPLATLVIPGIMAILLLYIGFELLAPFIGFKT